MDTQTHNIIADNLDLVHSLAGRMARRIPNMTRDEFFSAGSEGLIRASQRFDPSRGSFRAFAEFHVRGCMLNETRRRDPLGRRRRTASKRVAEVRAKLANRLGSDPNEQQMADALGLTVDAYHDQQVALREVRFCSIDQPTTDDGGGLELPAPDATPEQLYATAEERQQLWEAVATLPERDRRILEMYHGENKSLAEIAAVFGISQARVSQIKSRAVKAVRARLLS